MSRTGVDEFYETIRLLLAKHFWEESGKHRAHLTYEGVQQLLAENQSVVSRFVEGEVTLSAPEEVAEECLKIIAPAQLAKVSYDVLHTIFEQMTGRHYKSEKGQYFTPQHVVDFCISVLRPKAGETMCDPACGSGAFLKSAFDYLGSLGEEGNIFGFDISRRAVKTAAMLSYLSCKDTVIVSQADGLVFGGGGLFEGTQSSIEDIIREQSDDFEGFDIIATNPPFAGDVSDSGYLPYYETPGVCSAKVERDVLFLERCWRLLKPGGRMAIVLPDNKFSGSKFSDLRKWILRRFEVAAVVSLHSYTFRPYTSQKACVLFATKVEGVRGLGKIVFYRSDRAGKTSSGEPVFKEEVLDHDLKEISSDLVQEWKIGKNN